MNTVTLNGLLFQELIPTYLEPMQAFSLWQGALHAKDSGPNSDLTQLCHLGLKLSGNSSPLKKSCEIVCRMETCKIRTGKLQS